MPYLFCWGSFFSSLVHLSSGIFNVCTTDKYCIQKTVHIEAYGLLSINTWVLHFVCSLLLYTLCVHCVLFNIRVCQWFMSRFYHVWYVWFMRDLIVSFWVLCLDELWKHFWKSIWLIVWVKILRFHFSMQFCLETHVVPSPLQNSVVSFLLNP